MDRVLQRRDTAANWSTTNPILAEGEIGIITDGAKGYKIGDGVTRWNALEFPANPTSVVGELGDSEVAAINQNIVTEVARKFSIPFDGFVQVQTSSIINEKYSDSEIGSVMFNTTSQHFVYKVQTSYYSDWSNSTLYGTPYSYGMTPYSNKQYIYLDKLYVKVGNNGITQVPLTVQSPATIESDDYIYNVYYTPEGVETYEPSRLTTNFISVIEGQIIDYQLTGYSSSMAIIAFNSNKDVIVDKCIIINSPSSAVTGRYTVDPDVKYIRVTRQDNSYGLIQTIAFYKPNYLPIVEQSFNGILNITNSDFTVQGTYIDPNGGEKPNSSWVATQYITASEGNVIYYQNLYGTVGGAIIAVYDESKQMINVILGNSSYDASVYTLPEKASFIRFSYVPNREVFIRLISNTSKSNITTNSKRNTLISGFDEFTVSSTWQRDGEDLTVTGGGFTAAPATDTFEDEFVISCKLKSTVTSGSYFELGIAKNSTAGNYVGFWTTVCKNSTGSYLKFYWRVDNSYVEQTSYRQTITKGLQDNHWYTIKVTKTTDIVTKLIINLYDDVTGQLIATTTVSTNGTYSWGSPACINVTGTSRFSKFIMYYPKNTYPLITIYGDSFIEGDTVRSTKNVRWASLLQSELGKKDCLIYGHGGASAKSDITRILLQISRVNSAYAIIALGQNDASFSEWTQYVNYMLLLCKMCDITPVLVTTCPKVSQDASYITKMSSINEWIRNSNYNYIDANMAVTSDGLTWKDGYVLADGIHPSEQGHKAIFDRISIDCPFLLNT